MVMARSPFSFLCPPNTLSSASLCLFKYNFAASKPFPSCSSSLHFNRVQAAGHDLRVPPTKSTAAEEIVETKDEEESLIEVGYVADVYGLQGHIRVKHDTGFPELRFGKPGKRWLRQQVLGTEKVMEVELVTGRGPPGDKYWIVKLNGIDNIDAAQKLIGATFLVKQNDRPELEKDEFYSRDLVGMRVILKDTGEEVGTVVNVIDNAGQDLLHVKLPSTNKSPTKIKKKNSKGSDKGQRIWVPFVKSIVPVVDMDRREMHITPPEGLLQLNLRSDEGSKKELRRLKWVEKKRLQRRLSNAKKKLLKLEQQHILRGLTNGDKSQRDLLNAQIVNLNSTLLQQALKATEMSVNGYNEKGSLHDTIEGKIGKSLKIGKKHLTSMDNDTLHSKHKETGFNLISQGKLAIVLVLNSRSQSRSSETQVLNLEDGESSAITLWQTVLLDMQKFIKAEHRAEIPLILISPADTIQPLEELFARYGYFDFNPEKVRFLKEETIPILGCSAIEEKKSKVLMKSPWEILESPIGSGGVLSVLSTNKIMEDMIESGVDFVEVCSINQRYPFGNPIFLGFVNLTKAEFGVMTSEDRKRFEDEFHIVLPMESLKKLSEQVDETQFEAILKSYSHVDLVDDEWVEVIPSMPNAYEFHCSIYSLLHASLLGKGCLMEVRD